MPGDEEERRQNIRWGVGGLGCVGSAIFYFFFGVYSYWIGRNTFIHDGLGPQPTTYGTKPYWPIPPIVLGLVWLGLRRRYPDAAKGIRFALFVSVAFSLGALAVCR